MALSGLNLAGKKPTLPTPRVIPKATAEFERVVKEETHETDRLIAETDQILDRTPGGTSVKTPDSEANITGDDKLSRLVDDDFPFDDTQLTAIHGLAQEQYGVMIGAAGTGKTTTTKKLVDLVRDGLDEVDMANYWTRGTPADDDYEAPERLIPSIVMVSFTGRATQMIKKNFPRDWHGNIMTIHRALGFYPEYYPELDEDSGEMRNKCRFVPSYTAENLMPWDIIIVDEAGMLGLELWHQLWAATKSTARIILIGDINQLPPTHGKSILGFALATWPTWELTHVHRQQGKNNSIVDNAHRILKGFSPVSDSPVPLSLKTDQQMLAALNFMVKNDSWRFITVEVPEEHRMASLRIRQCLQLLQGKLYEPNRDVLITPINGFEQTNPGYSLGQAPLNQELVVKLNSKNPRYYIDAGREKQNFAEGDKVMATVNDYEAGITNGMTGIIKSIRENGGYVGDSRRWGLVSEVEKYMSEESLANEDDEDDFSLDEMLSDSEAGLAAMKDKEKAEKGPASHAIEVQFGEGDHGFTITFDTKSAVASLMLAYAATCHKMQGGECPVVFGIVHQANKRPLNREWYYTLVTRASEKCIVFMTRQGQGFALGKQNIKGSTLKAKIQTFVDLAKVGIAGASVRVRIPEPKSLSTAVTVNRPGAMSHEETKQEVIPAPARTESRAAESEPIRSNLTINVGALHIHLHEESQTKAGTGHRDTVVDGGTLRTELRPDENSTEVAESRHADENRTALPKLTAGLKFLPTRKPEPEPKPRLVSQWGAAHALLKLESLQDAPKMLTHQSKSQRVGGMTSADRTPITCPNCGIYHAGGTMFCDESDVAKKRAAAKPKPLSIGQLLGRGKS